MCIRDRTYTFRFLAIDTPETVKPNTPPAFMGKKASNYTKSALAKAEKIEVQYDGNRTDKYGRKLAWIFVDGQLLQDKLVKKGYARVYYVYGKYKYTNKLRASEKVAKRKKLGIWKNYKAAFPDSKSSSNKNLSLIHILADVDSGYTTEESTAFSVDSDSEYTTEEEETSTSSVNNDSEYISDEEQDSSKDGDYILEGSDSRYITEKEVENLSDADRLSLIHILRHWIF